MKEQLEACYKFFSEPRQMYLFFLSDEPEVIPFPVRGDYGTVQLHRGNLKSYEQRGNQTWFFWEPASESRAGSSVPLASGDEGDDEEKLLVALDVWRTCMISRCQGLPRAFQEIPDTGYAVRVISICPGDLEPLP